jgi:peroxin-6
LAATNRPDLIDPALLRPGRFEKLLYVGPCTSTEEKEAVIVAQTQKFNLTSDATAHRIAKLLSACDMTGADIYSICSNAWLSAVRRTVQKYKQGKGRKKDSDLTADMVVVGLDDFQLALTTKFVPSIKQSDMEYFNSLKQSFG